MEKLEDCKGCDGYVLNPAEAPYCPTCARARKATHEANEAENVPKV